MHVSLEVVHGSDRFLYLQQVTLKHINKLKILHNLLAKQTGTNRTPNHQSEGEDRESNATRHPHAGARPAFEVLHRWHWDTLLLIHGTT